MLQKTTISIIIFSLIFQIFGRLSKCPVGNPILFTQGTIFNYSDSLTISSLGAIFL